MAWGWFRVGSGCQFRLGLRCIQGLLRVGFGLVLGGRRVGLQLVWGWYRVGSGLLRVFKAGFGWV